MSAEKSKFVNWERFWCPQKGRYALDEDGFLAKRGDHWDPSPDAKRLEDLKDIQCLILLGEPGIGKTTTLKDFASKARNENPDLTLLVDLGEYSDEQGVTQAIFEDESFQTWVRSGDNTFSLFLDSVDECLIEYKNLSRFLHRRFEELGERRKRLRLRVACRTAQWLESLDNTLRELWGDSDVECYELLPLRAEDVELAANQYFDASNADAFVDQVREQKAGPLAAKPITLLKMLIPAFKNNGRIQSNQVELYTLGCRSLIREDNPHIREKTEVSTSDEEHWFRAAQFAAAVMLLCGKTVIDKRAPAENSVDGGIRLAELDFSKQGLTAANLNPPPLKDVEELLSTGLMVGGQASGLFRFYHNSYKEFLCALFLTSHNLSLTKLLPLFQSPSDEKRGVVPQLAGAAAWLASMNREFRDEVLSTDPECLLHSDIASYDDDAKRALVHCLVERLKNGEEHGWDWRDQRSYQRLRYPGIVEDFEKFLAEGKNNRNLRQFIVDVIEHAAIFELLPKLADIALNKDESYRDRVICSRVVARASEHSKSARQEQIINQKLRLRPLLAGDPAVDPDDDLRGYAIHALWPERMEASELFNALVPPNRPNYFGGFSTAIYHAKENLKPEHLPAALAWTEKQPRRYDIWYSFKELINRIFVRAWQYLDRPGVLEAFASAAVVRMRHYEGLAMSEEEEEGEVVTISSSGASSNIQRRRPASQDKCRKLCQALIPLLSQPEKETFHIQHYFQLVHPEDMDWIFERYLETANDAQREVWIQLALRVWDSSKHQEAVVRKYGEEDDRVRKAFHRPLALLKPESPESQAQREYWAQFEKPHEEPPLLDPPPQQRVLEMLTRFEKGDLNAWWILNREMTLRERSTQYGDIFFEADLCNLPGWENANEQTRNRIINAAWKYVHDAQAEPDQWVGQSKGHYPSMAGYRALRLLQKCDLDRFNQLSADVWGRWVSIVLDYPVNPGTEEVKPQRELIRLAFEKAPELFLRELERLIIAENDKGEHLYVLQRLESVWNNELCGGLLALAKRLSLKTSCLQYLLEELLEHNCGEARKYCLSIIQSPSQGRITEEIEAAAKALLVSGITGKEWDVFGNVTKNDEESRMRIFAHAAHDWRRGRQEAHVAENLSEEQIADLYIWLCQVFPEPKDPKEEGFRTIGPTDSAMSARNGLLGILRNRGSKEAIDQFQRLYEMFKGNPKYDFLHEFVIESRKRFREVSWRPLEPKAFARYLDEAKARLVRSERELLNVTLEVLEIINRKLQQKPPAAPDLWDTKSKIPKDEPELSNWLERHLRDELGGKGVIPLREVQIKKGEHPDLYLVTMPDTVTPEAGIIIEVKGCWNSEIKEKIEEQLANYLEDHPFMYGIYVVGWFYCNLWDDQDYRLKAHTKSYRNMDRSAAQQFFTKLAHRVTKDPSSLHVCVLDCRSS